MLASTPTVQRFAGYPLTLFVATRRQDVPAGVLRYASVDGSVPGAEVTWDHHVTGEVVNLDAMPAVYDCGGLQGVGTTLADTDAVASAVAVLVGGKGALPPATLRLLRSASYWCDHLAPDPTTSVDENARGRALHEWVTQSLRTNVDRSASFARVGQLLVELVSRDAGLPGASADPSQVARAQGLRARGVISVVGRVAMVDLTNEPPLDPLVVYALHEAPVAVTLDRHKHGGRRYTVGVNPFVVHPSDLTPALVRLAALEHAHGWPALLARPGPGSENWGGRATVFGSPWNYGSRLAPDVVVREIAGSLGLD